MLHDLSSGMLQDLYVMRRAVVIYERLIRRFTAQTTDYQVLLSTFAGSTISSREVFFAQEVCVATCLQHHAEDCVPPAVSPNVGNSVLLCG